MSLLKNKALLTGIAAIAGTLSTLSEPAPTIVNVTRAMITAKTIKRFQLSVTPENNGMLHVSVTCPKNKTHHLANASLAYETQGEDPVEIPTRITVDNTGADRLVFSTSKKTALHCLLTLHIQPKTTTGKTPKTYTTYRIRLADFIPTDSLTKEETKNTLP